MTATYGVDVCVPLVVGHLVRGQLERGRRVHVGVALLLRKRHEEQNGPRRPKQLVVHLYNPT